MIEIQLLRYALAAAETGSFRQAASHFRIKQSTLSRSIQYLEQRLGVPIFARSTRGVSLTAPGTAFMDRARSIVADVDALGREASTIARDQRQTLRVGVGYPMAAGELGATLRSYAEARPEVSIKALEGPRGTLLRALSSDRIDVAVFAGEPAAHDICSYSYWSDQVLVAVAPDNPLAALDRLYWTDLRASTFLVTACEPGPDIAQMIRSRLSAPGEEPALETQAVSPESLLPLVTGNRVAITFGNRPPSTRCGSPVFRLPHDAFGPTRLEQKVHWLSRNRRPVLAGFLEHLALRFGRAPRPVEE